MRQWWQWISLFILCNCSSILYSWNSCNSFNFFRWIIFSIAIVLSWILSSVITNYYMFENFQEPNVPIESYHPALCIMLLFSLNVPCCNCDQSFFNFCKENYQKIRIFFELFNWHSTLLPLEFDTVVNVFYDSLHQSIIDFVPKCMFRVSLSIILLLCISLFCLL